jgi:hypothetical protein
MIEDPIVEEVRARGRAVTARYHNSADELLRALRSLAEAQPQGVVDTIRVVAEQGSPEPTAPRGQSWATPTHHPQMAQVAADPDRHLRDPRNHLGRHCIEYCEQAIPLRFGYLQDHEPIRRIEVVLARLVDHPQAAQLCRLCIRQHAIHLTELQVLIAGVRNADGKPDLPFFRTHWR